MNVNEQKPVTLWSVFATVGGRRRGPPVRDRVLLTDALAFLRDEHKRNPSSRFVIEFAARVLLPMLLALLASCDGCGPLVVIVNDPGEHVTCDMPAESAPHGELVRVAPQVVRR